MGQLNMHVDPSFDRTLARLMRARGIQTKSAAIRLAVQEALRNATRDARATDFAAWIGLGLRSPQNPSPRFASDDDLWR